MIVDTLKYVFQVDTAGAQGQLRMADASVNTLAQSIGGGLLRAAGAVGIAFGAMKLFDLAKDATLTAARTEVMGTVMEQVGRIAGYSSGYLKKQEDAVKSLGITTQGARQQLILFMQSQLNIADAAKLARVAQDFAVIANENSSQSVQTLTEAIISQQPRLLRQYGIVVEVNDIMAKYAKSLGKSAEALTEFERKQAMLETVLEAGANVTGTYEAAMEDAGKQLTSLPRYIEEFANAVGNVFMPVLRTVVGGITSLFKGAREMILSLFDPLTLIQERLAKMGDESGKFLFLGILADQYDILKSKIGLTSDENILLQQAMAKIEEMLPGITTKFDEYGKVIGIDTEKLRELIKAHGEYKQFLEGQNFDELTASIERQEKAIANLVDQQQHLKKEYEYVFGELRRARSAAAIDYEEAVVAQYYARLSGVESNLKKVDGELKRAQENLDRLKAERMGLPDYSEQMSTEAGHQRELDAAKATADAREKLDIDLNDKLMKIQLQHHLISEEQYSQYLETMLSKTKEGTDAWAKVYAEWYELQIVLTEKAVARIVAAMNSFKPLKQPDVAMFPGISAQLQAQMEAQEPKININGLSEEDIERMKRDMARIADDTKRKFLDTFNAIGDAMGDIFYRLDDQMGNFFASIQNGISSIIAGGPAGIIGGVSSIVGGILNLFTDSTNEIRVSERELRDAIEQNTDALLRGTQAGLGEAEQAILKAMDIMRESTVDLLGVRQAQARKLLENIGINVPQGLTFSQFNKFLQEILEEIRAGNIISKDILNARTQTDFEKILRTGGLSYDDAREAIDYWVTMFDLTADQQKKLIEIIGDVFSKSGLWSADQQRAWNEWLKGLNDTIVKPDTGQTQTWRSVQTITESQGNIIAGLLNTINAVTRSGFGSVTSVLDRILDSLTTSGAAMLAGGGGGTNVSIGTISVNAPNTDPQAIGNAVAREVVNQGRAAGMRFL